MIPSAAKYTKEFNHSTRIPLVTSRPTEFGTIKVTSLKRTADSIVVEANTAPSSLAPLPASPCPYPYGSVLEVTLPFVNTVTLSI